MTVIDSNVSCTLEYDNHIRMLQTSTTTQPANSFYIGTTCIRTGIVPGNARGLFYDASTGEIYHDVSNSVVFTGATTIADGSIGLVPQPLSTIP